MYAIRSYYDELVNVVRQRASIPAGTCDFDLDTYLFEAHADDLSFKERQRIESYNFV